MNDRWTIPSQEEAEDYSRAYLAAREDYYDNLPRTNGDRLRSLPDEELAKAIARKITGCYGCPATNELECAECVLYWLREESDNG